MGSGRYREIPWAVLAGSFEQHLSDSDYLHTHTYLEVLDTCGPQTKNSLLGRLRIFTYAIGNYSV